MQVPENIRGIRVRLRRPLPSDAEALFSCTSDPEVARYMDWRLQTNFSEVVERLRGADARWESGAEYQWVIEESAGHEVIGTVACRIRGHSADFGYFLRRSAWGQGYAYESAGLLIDWLKQQPGVLRVWASVDVENRRSISLLLRLGLEEEGVLRMATIRPNIGGPPRDTMILAYCKNGL
jgi:[ribosomal protein S5]-alanine N-acetyltransferase